MSSKSKAQPTAVPASFIRHAFVEGKFTARDESLPSLVGKGPNGARGRLAPTAVEDFESQVKGYVYAGEKSVKEQRTITLPATKPNARGARLKRPTELPVSQVRALAGHKPGQVGRISSADIAKATEAFEKSQGWR